MPSWLWAQAGLLICIYLHVCKFHLLTLAGLGKTPVQKALTSPCGWLPAGASTQNLGSCFTDPSNTWKSLGFFPGVPWLSKPGASVTLPPPPLLQSPSPLGSCLWATFLLAPFLSIASATILLGDSLLTEHLHAASTSSSILCHLTPFPNPPWYPMCPWEAPLLQCGFYLPTTQGHPKLLVEH